MKKHWLLTALLLVLMLSLCVFLASCNDTGDGGSSDGGSSDDGSTDDGSTDGGSTDGGSTDGGSTDGGSTDGGSGSTDTTVHDFTYVLNANGTGYLISGVKEGVTAPVVPATYNGIAIVGIDASALAGNKLTEFKEAETKNTNFKISGGVLYSADGKTLLAYPGAKTGTSVKLANTVATVGDYAFAGNTVITSVDLNKAVGVGKEAFKDCTLLATVKATGNPLRACGEDAFENTAFAKDANNWTDGLLLLETYKLRGITRYVVLDTDDTVTGDITFNNTIYNIADCAFRGNENITSIAAHAQLSYIGAHAFEGCTALESFTYSEPDPLNLETAAIGEGAFMNCSSLKSFTVSNKVGALAEHTFENCTSLTYIVIAAGTQGMPTSTLRNTAITEVFYRVEPSGVAQIDAINGTSAELAAIPVEKRYLFYVAGAKSDDYNFWSFVNGVPTLKE